VAYVTVTACNKNYLGFSLKQRKDTVKILLVYSMYRRGVGRRQERALVRISIFFLLQYLGAEGFGDEAVRSGDSMVRE
jgi:hypothetical protein